ncbi:MAG: ATP-binding cassette domain-containing protein [Halieaceae bacterium]|jgi:lipoprotein-releasing system ATP-binding protein|nr:ATP-binding cassette domain-containing protein [Halieaceae bacterium]
MSDAPVLECRQLCRTYRDGALEVEVLRDVEFSLPPSAKVAIVGSSGSGKSTLLNLLGGLDLPTSGQVLMLGRDLAAIDEAQRCELRNRELGFVYQFHHLLPEFSACENVAMPLMISGAGRAAAEAQAAELLAEVGLSQRLSHRPGQLSGGERQRVAIARALVMEPACVLMDEPTGNLDPGSAAQVLELIDRLKQQTTASFVVVTHDAGIAAHMDRVYELRQGQLEVAGQADAPG